MWHWWLITAKTWTYWWKQDAYIWCLFAACRHQLRHADTNWSHRSSPVLCYTCMRMFLFAVCTVCDLVCNEGNIVQVFVPSITLNCSQKCCSLNIFSDGGNGKNLKTAKGWLFIFSYLYCYLKCSEEFWRLKSWKKITP